MEQSSFPYVELNKRVNYLLELKRNVVGIYFLRTKEEFIAFPAEQPKVKSPYCRFIKKVADGETFKLNIDHFGCPAAAIALGLIANNVDNANGKKHDSMHVYKDLEVSKQIAEQMVYCQQKTYGIGLMPLKDWPRAADVVLMITNPYNAMRIVQGQAYSSGQLTAIKMAGMQAICQEATSYPYETNRLNISLMCSGTRHVARWKDDEMCLGMPFAIFTEMLTGLEQTLNPMELLEKKKKRFS